MHPGSVDSGRHHTPAAAASKRARALARSRAPGHGCARHFRPDWIATLNVNFEISAIIALLAGILILVRPKLLNFIVAIYLIVIGILGLIR
jgi:hypothetical protein